MKRTFADLGVTVESAIQNGVRFYHFQKTGAPLTLHIPFDYGSIHAKKPGAAHFLEHMLVSGTKKWPTKDLLAEMIRTRGWNSNAYTWKHRMLFPLWCNDAKDIQNAFEYFEQILFESIFDKDIFEKERGAIFDEIRRRDGEMERYAYNKASRLLFPKNPLGETVLGTKEQLQDISHADLLSEWKQLLSADFCIVSIGDVSIADILKSAESLSKRFEAQYTRTEEKIGYTNLAIIPKHEVMIPFPQGAVSVLYNLSEEQNTREYEACLIFAKYLLSAQDGLLLKKLRFEKGLTYATQCDYSYTKYYGSFSASITCSTEKQNEVVQETHAVFENLLFESITESRRDDFFRERVLRRRRAWELADDWVDSYYMDFLVDGEKTSFVQDTEETLKSLPIEKISALLRTVFHKDNRSTFVFVPEK